MLEMKVYVIRHGLTPLNKKGVVNGQIDEPLAPEGIQQANEAINLLPESVKYIYTSPLLRARHTAEIVNSRHKRILTPVDALAEIHMGSRAGYSWEEMENGVEMKRKHRTVKFDYRPFGGESVDEVRERLLGFLNEVKERHKNKEVLFVTHGGIIRMLYLLENGQMVDESEKHVSFVEIDLNRILQSSKGF